MLQHLRKYLFCLSTLARKWAPLTCYKLQHNMASLLKGLVLTVLHLNLCSLPFSELFFNVYQTNQLNQINKANQLTTNQPTNQSNLST